MSKCFLAFDIGATSGRAVLGSWTGSGFSMREVHRFPNPMMVLQDRYYWDIYKLYASLIEALSICGREGIKLTSIGIDTWGVDYGWVLADGSLLGLPRNYRDTFTQGAPEELFKELPSEELYWRTGIQVLPFNTLFQLYRTWKTEFAPQKLGGKMLFMPDLLTYMLTGEMVCEYTIASTSQLLAAKRCLFDTDLLSRVGVSTSQICPLVMPGTRVGCLNETIARVTGVGPVPVIAVAGHDTASAVAAVPALSPRFAYLSSGTWSMMGIEVEKPILTDSSYQLNFTNEGGIEGTTRFLKNITGMWILERCRAAWLLQGKNYTYEELMRMAQESSYKGLINPDAECFSYPFDMLVEIRRYCKKHDIEPPATDADVARCVFYSLANRYKEVFESLSSLSPFSIDCLHVIGGGSRNALLNQLTADMIGMPVWAGPAEATAIGNCLLQAKSEGIVVDRWEMRRHVAESFPPVLFEPRKGS